MMCVGGTLNSCLLTSSHAFTLVGNQAVSPDHPQSCSLGDNRSLSPLFSDLHISADDLPRFPWKDWSSQRRATITLVITPSRASVCVPMWSYFSSSIREDPPLCKYLTHWWTLLQQFKTLPNTSSIFPSLLDHYHQPTGMLLSLHS